jgi:hypothetical protein
MMAFIRPRHLDATEDMLYRGETWPVVVVWAIGSRIVILSTPS